MPLKEILACFQGLKFESALDIGAGTGLFLEFFYRHGIIQRGIGVETNRRYRKNLNAHLAIVDPAGIEGMQFDLILFNDVLHHVENKRGLIQEYTSKYLRNGGCVFVKEVDNRKLLCKYFSRIHDLIMAGEVISEISPKEVKNILADYEVAFEGNKRILLYDHYWIMLKRVANK